jgi:hypothetical protein
MVSLDNRYLSGKACPSMIGAKNDDSQEWVEQKEKGQ